MESKWLGAPHSSTFTEAGWASFLTADKETTATFSSHAAKTKPMTLALNNEMCCGTYCILLEYHDYSLLSSFISHGINTGT